MWAFISSILDKYPIWMRKRGWHYYMFIKVCAKDSKSNVCLCTNGNLIMFSIKTQIDYIQFVDLFKIYFFFHKKKYSLKVLYNIHLISFEKLDLTFGSS